ncbi:MAG: hypothetical protein QOC64_2171 [Solirubrobacteraceae bacterium]|nr:hypothetical protein [Solirubrobacteraceae bacterium]
MTGLRKYLVAPPRAAAARDAGGPDAVPASAARGRSDALLARLRDALLTPVRDALIVPSRDTTATRPIDATPAPAVEPPSLRAAGAPSDIAVLCAAEDAFAVAGAAAALLARRHRTGCALACVWTAPAAHRHPGARPVAAGPARRLADALGARGLDAHACARAATVALPADAADAVVAARRALAAAGSSPTVVVVGGPRAAAFDALLAERERVVILAHEAADARIAGLAIAGLDGVAAAATARAPAVGPAARARAAAGLGTPRTLRRVLAAAVDGRP